MSNTTIGSSQTTLPTDAIALIAGVNFSSVIKVILALNVIHSTKGIAFDELLDMRSLPDSQADQPRRDATDAFVDQVLALASGSGAARVLQLQQRIGKRRPRHAGSVAC